MSTTHELMCPARLRRPLGTNRFLQSVPPSMLYLGLVAVMTVLVVPVGLRLLFGIHLGDTTLSHTFEVMRFRQPRDDSWTPMAQGFYQARQVPEERLYQTVFFQERVKFQYPPTSLLALYLTGHGANLAALGVSWADILKGVALALLYGSSWVVFRIFVHGMNRCGGLGHGWWGGLNHLLAAGAWLGLTLTFYPIVKAYTLGQIQVWINSLFAVLLWCWLQQRKKTAGFLLGVMCLIKPHYGIILLWGLFRRQWGFVFAGVATGLVGLAVSVCLFGADNHLDYLNVLSYIGRHGEGYYPNQSVNGLLNRLLFNGNNLEWDGHAFAPFHPVVYLGTLGATLALTALALFGPVRSESKGSAVDLALVALAATMASPIAWEHHYGILLPIFALLLPTLYAQGPSRRWALPLLGFAYLLTANFYLPANRLAATPVNFLQSYLLAGAMVVLALLSHARRTSPLDVPSPQPLSPQWE